MSIDFSFIVPAHNCAEMIKRTIDSIVIDADEAEISSYEIIMVENGSEDTTYGTCEKIAAANNKIKLLTSSKGVSIARNTGLEMATGDWLLFVDADDKWIRGSLKVISRDIKTYNSDLFVYGFKKDEKSIQHTKSARLYSTADELLECRCGLIRYPTLRMQVWAKVYRNARIQENHIRFNEKLSYSEDGDFLIKYTAKCNSIFLSAEVVYEYTIDTTSATRNSDKEVWGRKTCGYIDSMESTALYVLSEPQNIRKAFAEYALTHLNLILVRDVFEVRRKCSWKKRNKEMFLLINKELFANALKNVRIRDCLNTQMLPELFFKSHIGILHPVGGGIELC